MLNCPSLTKAGRTSSVLAFRYVMWTSCIIFFFGRSLTETESGGHGVSTYYISAFHLSPEFRLPSPPRTFSMLRDWVFSFGFTHILDNHMESLVEYIAHEWPQVLDGFLSKTRKWNLGQKRHLLAIFQSIYGCSRCFKVAARLCRILLILITFLPWLSRT